MEVVVALGVVLVIIMAILGVQLLIKESQAFSLNTLISVDHANGAVQQIVKQVRNAREGDNGAYMLEVVDDQELAFYVDIDRDDEIERVRYFVEEGELKRGEQKNV